MLCDVMPYIKRLEHLAVFSHANATLAFDSNTRDVGELSPLA